MGADSNFFLPSFDKTQLNWGCCLGIQVLGYGMAVPLQKEQLETVL